MDKGGASHSAPPSRNFSCLYSLNNAKFGHSILSIIAKTRCQLLSQKCTKFDFGFGYATDPTEGDYNAPRLDLNGLLLRGRGLLDLLPL